MLKLLVISSYSGGGPESVNGTSPWALLECECSLFSVRVVSGETSGFSVLWIISGWGEGGVTAVGRGGGAESPLLFPFLPLWLPHIHNNRKMIKPITQ